jgi:hypothetical protein
MGADRAGSAGMRKAVGSALYAASQGQQYGQQQGHRQGTTIYGDYDKEKLQQHKTVEQLAEEEKEKRHSEKLIERVKQSLRGVQGDIHVHRTQMGKPVVLRHMNRIKVL